MTNETATYTFSSVATNLTVNFLKPVLIRTLRNTIHATEPHEDEYQKIVDFITEKINPKPDTTENTTSLFSSISKAYNDTEHQLKNRAIAAVLTPKFLLDKIDLAEKLITEATVQPIFDYLSNEQSSSHAAIMALKEALITVVKDQVKQDKSVNINNILSAIINDAAARDSLKTAITSLQADDALYATLNPLVKQIVDTIFWKDAWFCGRIQQMVKNKLFAKLEKLAQDLDSEENRNELLNTLGQTQADQNSDNTATPTTTKIISKKEETCRLENNQREALLDGAKALATTSLATRLFNQDKVTEVIEKITDGTYDNELTIALIDIEKETGLTTETQLALLKEILSNETIKQQIIDHIEKILNDLTTAAFNYINKEKISETDTNNYMALIELVLGKRIAGKIGITYGTDIVTHANADAARSKLNGIANKPPGSSSGLARELSGALFNTLGENKAFLQAVLPEVAKITVNKINTTDEYDAAAIRLLRNKYELEEQQAGEKLAEIKRWMTADFLKQIIETLIRTVIENPDKQQSKRRRVFNAIFSNKKEEKIAEVETLINDFLKKFLEENIDDQDNAVTAFKNSIKKFHEKLAELIKKGKISKKEKEALNTLLDTARKKAKQCVKYLGTVETVDKAHKRNITEEISRLEQEIAALDPQDQTKKDQKDQLESLKEQKEQKEQVLRYINQNNTVEIKNQCEDFINNTTNMRNIINQGNLTAYKKLHVKLENYEKKLNNYISTKKTLIDKINQKEQASGFEWLRLSFATGFRSKQAEATKKQQAETVAKHVNTIKTSVTGIMQQAEDGNAGGNQNEDPSMLYNLQHSIQTEKQKFSGQTTLSCGFFSAPKSVTRSLSRDLNEIPDLEWTTDSNNAT